MGRKTACHSQEIQDRDDMDALHRHIDWMMNDSSCSTHRARYALLGYQSRQVEVDDLKGMIALLVVALKRAKDDPLSWKPWDEAEEFISKAEAMIKEDL